MMLMTPEDEQFLDALLEVLRADDGKELRSLLKSLSKSPDPAATMRGDDRARGEFRTLWPRGHQIRSAS
jgi:hypothetical protein